MWFRIPNFIAVTIGLFVCAMLVGESNGQVLYPALHVRQIPVIRNGRVDIVRDLVTATPVPQKMFNVGYIPEGSIPRSI